MSASFCLGETAATNMAVKALTAAQYDSNVDYRFMEQLRNYVQHAGMPIHVVTTGGSWIGEGNDQRREHSLQYHASKQRLLANGRFKRRRVLDELPDEIDLKLTTRGYMDSLSVIHTSAREMIASEASHARAHIQSAIDDYGAVHPDRFAGLHAICLDGDTQIEKVPILLDWDDVRLELEKRNRRLYLRRAHISTKTGG